MKRDCLRLTLLCAAIGSTAILSASNRQNKKTSPDLDGLKPGTKIDVIIQFVNPARAADLSVTWGEKKDDLPLIDAEVRRIPVNALAVLAKNPNVRYISPNRAVQGAMDYANEATGALVARMYGWDGQGVGVAIIDSGIYNHPDLGGSADQKSRIVYSRTFIAKGATDEFGHGTHVVAFSQGMDI